MPSKQTKPARGKKRQTLRANLGSQGGVTVVLCVVVVFVLFVCGWFMTGGQRQWNGWINGTTASASSGSESDGMTGRLTYSPSQPAELGVYSVVRHNDITETSLQVNFKLVGETSCENEGQFDEFMGVNSTSFREQVYRTVHEARMSELTDPDVLSRKIIAQINRVHESTFLESAELKGFKILEEVEGYEATPWQPNPTD